MLALFLAAALAVPVPRGALLDEAPAAAVVARGERSSEPLRGVAEYFGALAAFSALNAGAVALAVNESHFTIDNSRVSVDASPAAVVAVASCIVLSPLAAALTSWLIGKGSDQWDPSLGWAAAGAYGSTVLAAGAGAGLVYAGADQTTGIIAGTALYLAIPLGTVLLQNATKSPLP